MLRVYEPGDLSSGFVGIRVAVSVNAKIKQKYWSRNRIATEFAMEHAIEHEQNLLKKQIEYRNNRVFSRANNTGIVGLQITVDICKRRHITHLYDRFTYMYTKNGEIQTKSIYIKDYTVTDEQWFDICLFIKNKRTCKDSTFDKMLSMKPTTEHIKKELEHIHNSWNM